MTSKLINPFMVPTALQLVELKRLAALARQSHGRGWNHGTAGNFSIRGHGSVMWQSMSGGMKGDLTAEAFVPVDIETVRPFRPQGAKPSDETPLHAAIYRRWPKARAIVHVHPPFTVRLSGARKVLTFEDQEMGKAFGLEAFAKTVTLPMVANTQDMNRLSQDIDQWFHEQVPCLILRHHGVYAWGPSADKAMAFIEGIEFLCQTINDGP